MNQEHLQNQLIQALAALPKQTFDVQLKEEIEGLKKYNHELIETQIEQLKIYNQQLFSEEINKKKNLSQKTLEELIDQQDLMVDQINQNYTILKQVSAFELATRISAVEKELASRKAAIEIFSSSPKSLQYLFVISITAIALILLLDYFR